MRKLLTISLVLGLVMGLAGMASARDTIKIVGSSTVYPFATVVAETFGKNTDFPTPIVESTGSGGGAKLFCAGIGTAHPDFTNASRRMKKSELETCTKNGVGVIEVKVGYDGIAFANSVNGPALDVSPRQLYLALGKNVPAPDGSKKLVPNPYTKWSEIDPSLPDIEIEVLGPPPTSGTRDAFVELVMEQGGESFDFIDAMDKKAFKAATHPMREDGAFIEAGENDNLIIQKLEQNADAFGIFGYSFLAENEDKVKGATIAGKKPTFDNIANGSYPVSRPLYTYAKKQHIGVIPGMMEYLDEFTAESTWGPNGYLVPKGLIPMPEEERKKFRSNVENQTLLTVETY